MSQFSPAIKNAVLVAIVCSPISAMAYTGNPAFNGYYGQAMGGVLTTYTKMSASANSTYTNFYDNANQVALAQSNVRGYDSHGTVAFALGYGHFLNNSNFHMAGEVFANFGTRSNSLDNSGLHTQPNDDEDIQTLATSTKVKLRNEYGIDFRPGYLFDTNTLVYGRIGLAFNKMTGDSTDTFTFTDLRSTPSQIYNSSISQSQSHNRAALRLGLGIEHAVTENLAVTADYIYTYYGKVNTSGVGNSTSIESGESGSIIPVVNVNGLSGQSSGTISTQSAMIGIKYYFMHVC